MKKGEKYIIEIAEVHTHYDDNGKAYPMARIKGFSALTFDEKGLSKLEKVADNKPVEYLNCRFVVTGWRGVKPFYVHVGKIYEVKNGTFVSDSIDVFPLHRKLTDANDLVSYMKNEYEGVDICVIED